MLTKHKKKEFQKYCREEVNHHCSRTCLGHVLSRAASKTELNPILGTQTGLECPDLPRASQKIRTYFGQSSFVFSTF